jgi:FkbM family methyltransferase
MTISCRDTDYIKKVKDAGKSFKKNNLELQRMHNGIDILKGGYHGEWMTNIIENLKGHHEPQEEKAFYEVLKKLNSSSTMIELGSFWSYYSIWFNKQIKNAQNICCEPDPNNIKIGISNAKINNAKIKFLNGAAGKEHNEITEVVMDSDNIRVIKVPILSVDGLVEDYKLKKIDLLHLDVQGFEYDTLLGTIKTIKQNKIRFIFVSTHHYYFSGNPNTHGECLDFIKNNSGHIILSHTIAESFSGDGLIVASFDEHDKDFYISTSLNHTDHSLFRAYEKDLKILSEAYDNSI